VRGSKLVSNPGCYATNNQALIAPLLSVLDLARGPTVFGVSGYSGAGTKASETPTGERKTVPKITPEDLAGGIRAYALTDHIHEREAGYQLSKLGESEVNIAFIPHVAPWFQGILSTLSAPLKTKMTSKQVKELYREFFADEQLVKVQDQVPEIKDVALQHGVKIGGFQVNARGDRVVVVAAIDNLLKGAATQCLQVSVPYRRRKESLSLTIEWLGRVLNARTSTSPSDTTSTPASPHSSNHPRHCVLKVLLQSQIGCRSRAYVASMSQT
jgi:N-acetyl-gamma-glutamyl-phosphate reductase/acetylglutamate kinase